MEGPYPLGSYSRLATTTAWEGRIVRGQHYRVVKPFRDFDGAVHSVGEEWSFISSSFLPYDDGLSVFVADDDGNEWHIRLCWRPEDQGEICDNFSDYVQPIVSNLHSK